MREKLRRQLEEASIFNDTSMNSEIVDRLERSLGEPIQLAEAVGGKQNARLVRAVLDAMRSVTSDADADDDPQRTRGRLCAALVGVAQGVSGLRAESLLKEFAMDDGWRNAAARAVARHEDVHEFVADVLVVNPENHAALDDAERAAVQFKRPTIAEILDVAPAPQAQSAAPQRGEGTSKKDKSASIKRPSNPEILATRSRRSR
jgi:hypothetical protein